MSTTEMPATEANSQLDEQELASYELAYHVLPTVAEGEVGTVRDELVAAIEEAGGLLGVEEAPQRIDLAYEIIKSVEGKNRRFGSAYFGWIRFTVAPEAIATITEAVQENRQLLRHLLIRLNKVEAEHPFYYHQARAAEKQVTDIEEKEVLEEDIDPNAEITEEEVDTSGVDGDTKVADTVGTDSVAPTEPEDTETNDTDTEEVSKTTT